MTFKSFNVIEEPERFYEKDYLKENYDVCPALCMQVQKMPDNKKRWKDGIAKWCYCGLECEWCTLTPKQAKELSLSRHDYIEKMSHTPVLLKRCKDFESCESAKHHGCKGCNVWNYLYDIKALQKWCKEQNKDFMLFTMDMQKMLKPKEDIQ